MASLTESSIIARKVIRYGIYALILVITGRFAIQGAVTLYRQIFPPPPPKPTVAFGRLPELPFPEKGENEFTYTLDLAEGQLPELPQQTEVYYMPPFQSTISSVENAKANAGALGFNPDGRVLVESIPNVYVFQKNNVPSNLTMNVITGVFSISYNVDEDPIVVSSVPPNEEQSVNYISDELTQAKLISEDYKNGPTTTKYLKLEGGEFVPAASLSESVATKVNFFRKGYGSDGTIPSVTQNMPEGNLWFIIAGGRGKQIVAGEYHYFPIDQSKSGTYPLKSSQTAWDELKEGKAYIANPGTSEEKEKTIRKVYLAYYDAGQYTQFYQPVVVFEGDDDFYAFVSAIQNDYYGAKPEDNQDNSQ